MVYVLVTPQVEAEKIQPEMKARLVGMSLWVVVAGIMMRSGLG